MSPSTTLTPPSASTATTTNDPTPTVEAPPVTVDPGQVIRVNARFPNAPEKILFSYLPPNSDAAVHDPGVDMPGTEIQREGAGDLFFYSIDTRGMHGGLGWWYFVSEDDDASKRRAKVGKFLVRDVPRALTDRSYARPAAADRAYEADGFDLLGAVDSSEPEMPRGLVGAAIGAAAVAVLVALVKR